MSSDVPTGRCARRTNKCPTYVMCRVWEKHIPGNLSAVFVCLCVFKRRKSTNQSTAAPNTLWSVITSCHDPLWSSFPIKLMSELPSNGRCQSFPYLHDTKWRCWRRSLHPILNGVIECNSFGPLYFCFNEFEIWFVVMQTDLNASRGCIEKGLLVCIRRPLMASNK